MSAILSVCIEAPILPATVLTMAVGVLIMWLEAVPAPRRRRRKVRRT
ncbi:hypothetical protein OOZ54_12800 [Rhodopseudomonas palustris]|nr:hypothetical protein [Rhodopseudomonas palustris]WBU27573.1 hypothetical protein OOZ54_12800 [Rhodopseudomonas palustris]